MRIKTEPSNSDQRAAAPELPTPLAEAVVSCICLRDLQRLRVNFPKAVSSDDAEELRSALAGHLRLAIADTAFDDLRARVSEMNLDAPTTDVELDVLFTVLILRVPGVVPKERDREVATDEMRKAVATCQGRIGGEQLFLCNFEVDGLSGSAAVVVGGVSGRFRSALAA